MSGLNRELPDRGREEKWVNVSLLSLSSADFSEFDELVLC